MNNYDFVKTCQVVKLTIVEVEMQVGIVLLTAENQLQGCPRYTDIRDTVQKAEALGFSSVWLFDHLMYRWPNAPTLGIWECWTIMAALAESTNHIGIGSLVICSQFRNPALLAKMAITLDEVSNGRFTLGLGAGWHEPEFTAYGVPFDKRVSRFNEAIQIIHPLIKNGFVNFSGDYYQAVNCEILPYRPSSHGPALLIGGKGHRMLRLAARYADTWNTGLVTLESFEESNKAILDACSSVGRDTTTLKATIHLPVVFNDLGLPPPYLNEYLSGSDNEIAMSWAAFARAGVSHLMVEYFPRNLKGLDRLAKVLDIFKNINQS